MSALAAPLDAHVRLRPHFRRSINVERDLDEVAVRDYIPTSRALEVLRRLSKAMSEASSGRAFSLTGPYGVGKSSFAVFLSALLGGADDSIARAAFRRLEMVDAELLEEVLHAVRTFGVRTDGFIRAVAVAQREPVSITVVRALTQGAERFWGGRVPRELRGHLDRASGSELSARDLGDLLAELASHAPVLLVIDELGKNLEFFAQNPADGDIFVLQHLAERVSGERAAKAIFVTLQHVAFEQYAASATVQQRREWSKVQGRFQDISFLHDTQQTLRLIAQSLDSSGASPRVSRDIRSWANAQYATCGGLGLVPQLIINATQIEECYPLNPVAALALSELCARFGQHDRTLFSFLAGAENGTVARFLAENRATSGSMPALPLDAVWDYFLESASTSVRNSPDGARWLEIDTRIRDVHGLGELEVRCVKAIGLLNLLARGGALRASPSLIAFALDLKDDAGRREVKKALRRLEGSGLLTYRSFADEYRIWEGTDFDIAGQIELSRERLQGESLAHILERVQPLRPVVANRHSQRVGMLRYFAVRFLSGDQQGPLGAEEDADGLIGVVLGSDIPEVQPVDARPVVLVQVEVPGSLAEAATEAAAILDVLDRNAVLATDWVARHELQERASVALHKVRTDLDAEMRAVRVARLAGQDEFPVSGSLSRIASEVSDRVYALSPQVRNEVLGRRDLSSQGAKARRELLAAMIGKGALPCLGMDHFGPERAMYEATLHHTGMHREGEDGWTFAAPDRKDTWSPAWRAAEELIYERLSSGVGFDELYRVLQAPPYGLKDGPIPVLLVALLLARSDEVAVYQDGTYQAELTEDLLERLVKTPNRFSTRAIKVSGLRAVIVEELGVAIGAVPPPPRRRNPTVLRVVSPLLAAVRNLPDFTRRSGDLGPETVAVRDAIGSARDPAELLFSALPAACAMKPVSASARGNATDASTLVERVLAALDELDRAYPRMLEEAASTIAATFGVPSEFPDLRTDLRARARPLEDRVIDPQMRSFLLHALDTQLDDEQWLEAVLFSVTGVAPSSWRDEDSARFAVRLGELSGAFRRIEALHYDAVAADRAGFDARRVTITAPTGREVSSVFWVEHGIIEHVNEAAELALGKLAGLLGPRALPALLAVLASRADAGTGDSEWEEGTDGTVGGTQLGAGGANG